jgi:hypothetical protein
MIAQARRLTIYTIAVSQIALGVCGCRQQSGGASSGAGNALNAASSQSNVSVGEIAFQVARANAAQAADHPQEKTAALDARHQDFVQAIDTMLPQAIIGQTSSVLDDVVALVQDGTLPDLTNNLANVLDLLANDPQDPQQLTLNALASLSNARAAVDKDTLLRLGSRLLAYPDLSNLFQAIVTVVQANDGSNGSRDLLTDLLGVGSRVLEGLARPQPGAPAPASDLVNALLESIELRGNQQVGSPAWAVRADVNGNPAVARDPSTGLLYAPFVDAAGVAAVNAGGDPIDGSGNVISIPAFGTSGARDADDRALAYDGNPLYVYFDSKKTALGEVLTMAGALFQKDVPNNLLQSFDGIAGRVQRTDANGTYTGYASDDPLIDLAWGGLEVFRYKDAPKLLEGLSALIQSDRTKAENLMVKLAQVIDILRNSTFQTAANTGGPSTLDQIVPQLNAAFNANGSGQASTTARSLLNAFNSQQAQLHNLPAGLAKMMKYTDVDANNNLVAVPGNPSLMERLLDMIREANGCTIPFSGDNMANVYLDAMAGNYTIFGITISVYTMNSLSFLFPLLCSQIQQQNLTALNAFAISGALDAMIPIAKVFSDAGQTDQLKNVMLALQVNYDQTMRPNEPVIVQILESGMVEQLFDALNMMTTTQVPSTGELMSDVTADFLAAMVDTSRGIVNRQGQPVMSLLHLVIQPISSLSDRIDQRGLRNRWDAAKNGLLDVALERVMDPTNTFQQLKNQGLISITAAALKRAANGMSMLPNVRNQDITTYESNVVDLMTGRNLPVLVDVFSALEQSSVKQAIHDAIVHLFTPDLTVKSDAYGAVLQVLAATLQAKADPVAMTDLLHFAGKVLEPARGLAKPIVEGLMKLLVGKSGNTLLEIIRNGVDKGPNGTARSPIETLFSILDDVQNAGQPAGAAPAAVTAQSIKDSVQKLVNFLRDPNGLGKIWAGIRNGTH